MKTSKLLFFAALGVATYLLLTSDKTEDLRDDIAENAGKWSKKLGKLASGTGDKLVDLKKLVSDEIEGLGSDARKRITNIIDESMKSAKSVKSKAESQLS